MQLSAVLTDSPVDPAPGAVSDRAADELGAAVVTFLRTWRCISRRGGEQHRAGLTALEMSAVIGEGERRLSELAELRNVDQSVISRQVGELEAQGLVSRRPDPADRRASLIRLTPEGLRVLEHAHELRRGWLRDALARVPAVDVQTAGELIRALTAELATHAEQIGPGREGPPRA